jgi:excisionase family DNA binding protein
MVAVMREPSESTTERGTPGAPLTLTVEETAEALGIGRTSAYEAIRRGEIPSLRFGRRVVVPRAALLRLLGEETVS